MSLKHVLLALLLLPQPALSDEATERQELERLRLQVEQMKQLLLLQDAQLRQMEQRAAMAAPAAAPIPTVAPAPTMAPPVVAPAPAPTVAPAPPVARVAQPVATPAFAPPPPTPAVAPEIPSPPTMPAKAAGVDPAPFDAAVAGRVGMIRISQPPAWLALDEQRLVLWLASDEAYLLELDLACPGLLSMPRLDLETFSTKLRSGQDAVKVAGRRCPIAAIKRLSAGRIPKPPRR
jgi:hypothetical protein